MKRSKFSLSHTKLLSMRMGYLVPVTWFEVLPGDTVQQATNALVRAAPLLAPVMHRCDVRIHHWYVPNRIIWDDWEDFITGGPDGDDATVAPYMDIKDTTVSAGELEDYLGLPVGSYPNTANAYHISALPFRAYQMVWNEFYRDQDLQTEATVSLDNGQDTNTSTTLQRIGWEKDYLTSSRPWEQKGTQVTIPLGDTAPVDRVTNAPAWEAFDAGSNTLSINSALEVGGGAGLVRRTTGTTSLSFDPNGGLEADLSGASAVTINVLREAFAIQRYQEARARFGSRYVEYLRYLGVRSSDARLQRPEYLGGGRQSIQFSEVLQTAEGTDPVGQMRGHGITGVRSNRYRRFFEEHGIVMSMMSVRPKTIYMQAIGREWGRTTKEDYWQKELQHIGQQEVLNREAYAFHTTPVGQWGFQDRYDEYRRKESSVAGEFQESVLNFWHLARDFASSPALNSDFVSCNPTTRVFAAGDEDTLYVMANHSIQARRMVASSGSSFIY